MLSTSVGLGAKSVEYAADQRTDNDTDKMSDEPGEEHGSKSFHHLPPRSSP